MRRVLLALTLTLTLNGCACLGAPGGLLALGVVGSVITRDPGHVIAPAIDLIHCCIQEGTK